MESRRAVRVIETKVKETRGSAVQYAVLSDIGKKRSLNEDRAAIFTLPNDLILAVIADGMGGHKGGDFASSTALRMIEEAFQELGNAPFQSHEDWTEWLKETVLFINRTIYNHAIEKKELSGMGTTLEALLIKNDYCYGTHIGDSRVYQISERGITQITTDHSYVKVLVDSGEITEQEAEVHPQRNWIIKALGSERSVEPDCYSFSLESKEYLLLCSDGLSNKVSDSFIQEIVLSNRSLNEKVKTLVAKANELGGEDNISVILLQVPSGVKQI